MEPTAVISGVGFLLAGCIVAGVAPDADVTKAVGYICCMIGAAVIFIGVLM